MGLASCAELLLLYNRETWLLECLPVRETFGHLEPLASSVLSSTIVPAIVPFPECLVGSLHTSPTSYS